MKHLKSISLFSGIVAAVAACISLFTASSDQATEGNNSPIISGNGNTVNFGGLSLDPESIKKNKPNISQEQYQLLQQGMTYQEVLDIVKVPGVESGTTGRLKIYTWGTATYIYMTISFVDGKLHSKNQSGL
ncbi:hypothetical protein ACYCGP_02255 [Stutzerimonas nitrititolerans]|uniref:hypothetical protein n=1 Tax=Stutzerimonas nitrititolerans TaxID=2482751 RepID=UPI0028B18988|nr:hypothetical protein [Stutzerimonas nitrititolerans]